MSKLEANPVTVKSLPDTNTATDTARTLMETLQDESLALGQKGIRSLSSEGKQSEHQAGQLIQTAPVNALQLHDSNRIVDPVLLPPGARVAVLTDKAGQAALAVSRARPHWNVLGWVNDTKTFMNLQATRTPANLSFDKKPKTARVDAILAVGWAHQTFSQLQYNVNGLMHGVRELLSLLPENGQLLIQDFYLPDVADHFVTLEIDNPQTAQALLEFSSVVRPHAPKAMQGFFIETLSAPHDRTRRFHLPLKWAVEFYHRWRHGIAIDAPYELTTLPLDQWAALVEQCGARASYRAPHPLSRQETKEILREIRFIDDQGNRMPLPPASFTLVVEKIADAAALQCYEHHVTREKVQDILISGFRDKATDQKIDVVEIRHHEDDVLPWYCDADHQLHVLVRMNVSRPIINAVPRGTPNLDSRHWAGYLIEPLTLPHLQGEIDQSLIHEALAADLGLAPSLMGAATISAEYYPAPEYLAQRVRGLLLPLNAPLPPGFSVVLPDGSRLVDVLADDVLRAISAGLIPDGKLEILIGGLMREKGIQPREIAPIGEKLDAMRAAKLIKDRRDARQPRAKKSGEHLMEFLADTPSEKLRAVRSVFVEDRMTDYGRFAANHMEQEFIVANQQSGNTAVCIPLMKDPVDGLMMSGEPRRLPIPQRMGSPCPLMQLPSFSLPSTVRNLDEARMFLARQLGCDMDDLHVMGHSFFVQPQLSVERVYPFLLTAPPQAMMRTRWYKPRNVGLQRAIDRHVDKTSAYIEYKFGRDTGEWYRGFTPDIVNGLTGKTGAANASGNDNTAMILDQHPAAQLKLI